MGGVPVRRRHRPGRMGQPGGESPTKRASVDRLPHRSGWPPHPPADGRRPQARRASASDSMLLAIDTSTHYASVAVHDGTRLLSEHTWLANQDHTRTLMPAIRWVMGGAGS